MADSEWDPVSVRTEEKTGSDGETGEGTEETFVPNLDVSDEAEFTSSIVMSKERKEPRRKNE